MAVAAFKSSSRRGNQPREETRSSSSSSSNKAPIRRSRSVSALSRSNLDISTDFLNKRDNPLFDEDSKIQSTDSLILETSKLNQTTRTPDPKGPGSARGRSVARNRSDSPTGRKETGRSLSRVDTGRRTRSASQCPVSRQHWNYSTSESEAEPKDHRKGGLLGSDDHLVDQVKDLHHIRSSHQSSHCSSIEVSDSFAATFSGLRTQNCDDTVSTASSGYVSDEKTIKAVCEQKKPVQGDQLEASDIYETVRSEVRRAISEIQNDLQSAIQRSNATAIAFTNVADIPLDLVNPGAVELVLEIRGEYAKKLEESQERARNLRADLAVEEHRGQELDRILKEELPYPITPIVQKSRPSRKASIERRRMSRRLEEDAKAYFDECVSLSTFDSSDFSSQEDPPLKSVGPPIPSCSHVCLPEESSIQGQFSSITSSTETDCKACFSFAQKPSETSGLQKDIQQYIKKFEKSVSKLPMLASNFCDLSEYSYQSSSESLLIDRVLLKNRIDSGSVLLCGGGNILSSKSFVG